MADASFRYQQQPAQGTYFYSQHNNNHPRSVARNGSPVNSSRGPYSNDTPSPSRSPVSQASSQIPYNMYNHGQAQNQGLMMNGAGAAHQRYQGVGMGQKFPHQNHQAHQQNNHQNATPVGMGHQATFSSGNLSHATPHYSNSASNAGLNRNEQLDVGGNISLFRLQQIEGVNDSRSGAQHPHRHCKSSDAVRLLHRGGSVQPDESKTEDCREERNRASVTDIIRRQDWDALDFSGQGLRAIARPVFVQFKFLRRLFLDHNHLNYMDPSIGQLRLLSHLDVSDNSITEIPPEIGMLVNLKEFLLFENQVRRFPTQIGHLYKLELLGVEGNPLDAEVESRINIDGTASYIDYERERHKPETPPERQWKSKDEDADNEEDTLSILSYNILCDKYATVAQYGYTPSHVLHWERRRMLILRDIELQDADFVCLQEVDRESFQAFFQLELANKGYKGIFYPKSRAKTMAEAEAKLVDGCAIFYKNKKYICLDKMVVDFGSTAINRQDMKGEHDIFNRVMPRDNISVVAFVENRVTGARFMIGNAHIYWDPNYEDVKIVQVAILMEAIARKADEWSKRPACIDKSPFRFSEEDSAPENGHEGIVEFGPSLEYDSGSQIPLILCGDFNSAHESGVNELITQGELSGTHRDLSSRSYGKFTRDGMHHPFKLKSAYGAIGELNFTNYTPNFTGVLDYIWYSYNAMEVRGLLGDVDEEYLRCVPGFPNEHFPSDHLALKAEFGLKAHISTKAAN